MCGILAVLNDHADEQVTRQNALKNSKRLRHRGPDWSGIHVQHTPKGNNFMVHERLSIVDPESGAQPLFNGDKSLCLCTNGEIYNHKKLRAEHLEGVEFATQSDCEVIVHLYEKMGVECVKLLDGMYSFCVANSNTGEFMAARDPIGITPLYYGYDGEGAMWIASELKGLNDVCVTFSEFPPGHYYDSTKNDFIRYYEPEWWNEESFMPPESPLDLKVIRETFIAAVEKRMMADVPYGVLLSGGLDSSLVASIASRYVQKHQELGISRLHSFSVGLKDSPDLVAAKKVAEHLGTIHHTMYFTLQEGLDAISDVIFHLETYDVTTIRASTPMYLMSRKIKAMGVKMVLSGEGADEVYGGYLYFHKAPNREEFQKETVRKLQGLHSFDCLRANKSTSAWGVEARVPFLDRDFLDVSMNIDPTHKMISKEKDADGKVYMEKYIVRKAFDTPEDPFLPESVLWRQKEQFSDGVGYGWIDCLKDHAEKVVTDRMFENAKHRFPINTPHTKEAYFYRNYFELHYPQAQAANIVPGGKTIACSTPAAIEWDKAWKNINDASGRSVPGVHIDAY